MQFSKLKFSDKESEALAEKEFFLLKNSVTEKIVALFGEIERDLKSDFVQYGIDLTGLNSTAGKIFRGENYRLFPYIMLDYPRLFSAKSVFAFRTMLWWGHEFSFTLHIQGEAFEKYSAVIFDNFTSLNGKDVYYCINDTPWQYTFESENYQPVVNGISREQFFSRPFMKISRKIPVSQHVDAGKYCKETFKLFLGLLRSR